MPNVKAGLPDIPDYGDGAEVIKAMRRRVTGITPAQALTLAGYDGGSYGFGAVSDDQRRVAYAREFSPRKVNARNNPGSSLDLRARMRAGGAYKTRDPGFGSGPRQYIPKPIRPSSALGVYSDITDSSDVSGRADAAFNALTDLTSRINAPVPQQVPQAQVNYPGAPTYAPTAAGLATLPMPQVYTHPDTGSDKGDVSPMKAAPAGTSTKILLYGGAALVGWVLLNKFRR